MKKSLLPLLILIPALVLAGCQAAPSPLGSPDPTSLPLTTNIDPDEADAVISLRVVDGAGTDSLLLAGEREIYTLHVDDVPISLDGRAADPFVLENGMPVDVSFDGTVLETWPARFSGVKSLAAYSLGSQRNPGGTMYDLCGLYLQVLDDLWDRDEGLNGGVEYVSVDLSDAPGELTDGEKAAIAWAFAQRHSAAEHPLVPLSLTYQELADQGYLTKLEGFSEDRPLYQWENGLLFSITADETDGVYSLPAVLFNAEKWRTPLGAYFFSHCSAVWPEMGTWTGYNIGGEAIS